VRLDAAARQARVEAIGVRADELDIMHGSEANLGVNGPARERSAGARPYTASGGKNP
jgi:hypothetical protein